MERHDQTFSTIEIQDRQGRADDISRSASASPDGREWIAESAYYKALSRGFSPEAELNDWLEAEQEYLALINREWKSGLVRLR